MDFLPWTNAYHLQFSIGNDRLKEILHFHRWCLGNENLSHFHVLESIQDDIKRVFKPEPESRHFFIGNADFLRVFTSEKHIHNAASASYPIPITHAGETRASTRT